MLSLCVIESMDDCLHRGPIVYLAVSWEVAAVNVLDVISVSKQYSFPHGSVIIMDDFLGVYLALVVVENNMNIYDYRAGGLLQEI